MVSRLSNKNSQTSFKSGGIFYPLQLGTLSIQHVFAMFGSSVLVPVLLHFPVGLVLFMNGCGTLLFIAITKGKVPSYLGSSFAFITPTLALVKGFPIGTVFFGFMMTGLTLIVIAGIIKYFSRIIQIILPTPVIGVIVMVIGLQLLPVAGHMAGWTTTIAPKSWDPIIVSTVTLSTCILFLMFFRGFLAMIPILLGIIVGCIFATYFGLMHWEQVWQAPWFHIPPFNVTWMHTLTLKEMLLASITFVPIAFVILAEHAGHFYVTEAIIQKPISKDPGLHRSVLGDGVSTMLSGFVGSVPTTTYGENIGVLAMTRVYKVSIIAGAAIVSMFLGFIGKLSVLVVSIPSSVIGGISLILFGIIAASGIRILVENKVKFQDTKTLGLVAIVLGVGLSNISVPLGSLNLQGMSLSTVVGIGLSLLLYLYNKLMKNSPA